MVTVEFEATSDSAESMSKLRAKVADAEAELPDEAETPKSRKSPSTTRRSFHSRYMGTLTPGYWAAPRFD